MKQGLNANINQAFSRNTIYYNIFKLNNLNKFHFKIIIFVSMFLYINNQLFLL